MNRKRVDLDALTSALNGSDFEVAFRDPCAVANAAMTMLHAIYYSECNRGNPMALNETFTGFCERVAGNFLLTKPRTIDLTNYRNI